MRIATLLATLLFVSASLQAADFNTATVSGEIDGIFNGFPYVDGIIAIRVYTADGESVLVECHEDAASGCDLVTMGDNVLVTGKLGFHSSCNILGVANNCLLPDKVYTCDKEEGNCVPILGGVCP